MIWVAIEDKAGLDNELFAPAILYACQHVSNTASTHTDVEHLADVKVVPNTLLKMLACVTATAERSSDPLERISHG
jgi:hypothetical protein